MGKLRGRPIGTGRAGQGDLDADLEIFLIKAKQNFSDANESFTAHLDKLKKSDPDQYELFTGILISDGINKRLCTVHTTYLKRKYKKPASSSAVISPTRKATRAAISAQIGAASIFDEFMIQTSHGRIPFGDGAKEDLLHDAEVSTGEGDGFYKRAKVMRGLARKMKGTRIAREQLKEAIVEEALAGIL